MPLASRLRIGVVAAEPSGDRLGSGVVAALLKRAPTVELRGIGGPELGRLGLQSACDIHDLSIMGLEDLWQKLPNALKIRNRLISDFSRDPPDLFLGIDSPDFNLNVERRLRKLGIPVMHLVSPTVWAWRGYRVRKIRKAVDRILVLFPFEKSFYEKRGVPATFVGHPAARETAHLSKEGSRNLFALVPNQKIVSILPGSRESEIRHLSSTFVASIRRLAEADPALFFLIPFASGRIKQQFLSLVSLEGLAGRIRLVDGQARECLAASDVALLASGTAALEAALVGCPMVVAYRVSELSYRVARALASTHIVSMPNHLMPEPLVPEFLQKEATEENLVPAVQQLLLDTGARQRMRDSLLRIQEVLNMDTNEQIVDTILEKVERR
ncbi:MAG: lipid-A-disaccharide synthase [Proteobacteria bacterium TMED51]|nr:MAG: lipid-A-disaccharide synthase [Candidatus Thioglobus sp. MED-G23]RPG01650.1 MAG: lipid-A-disaccharide synthase [Proteobacteria bacterium TMED51]HCL95047.1 lipid-A-disaccharide synthase [Gammaproteobacteria bacterium]